MKIKLFFLPALAIVLLTFSGAKEGGKALGGSWNDTGYDVRVESVQAFSGASPYVGFRPVMVLRKK